MKTYFVKTHACVRDISVELGQNIVEMRQKVEEFEVLGTIWKKETVSQSILQSELRRLLMYM